MAESTEKALYKKKMIDYYLIHMGPTVAYILCHRNPEHALLSDFLNYVFNHIMLQTEEESKTLK
jgi:hypothetical protein